MARFVTFASGSSGNCALLSDGETHILLDAGISARSIKNCLAQFSLTPGDLTAVLLTHEHTDHICGVGTLAKYFDIPLYATVGTTGALRQKFPRAAEQVTSFTAGESFSLGGVLVESFRTPHDAAESCGYRIYLESGRSLALATDLGYVPENVLSALYGAETVLLESNHDVEMLRSGPYPYPLKQRILGERGHLSNDLGGETAMTLVESGTETVILGHLSRQNNTPSVALETVTETLRRGGAEPGRDLDLSVAPAMDVSRTYTV